MSRIIQQNVEFDASPNAVYDAVINGSQFSEVTGAPADSGPEVGARVSLFGGEISGRNVELVPGKRIVQAWRSAGWEDGAYSIVRFEFEESGEGTALTFEHVGFPDGEEEMLAGGWHQMYWEPLKAYLGE